MRMNKNSRNKSEIIERIEFKRETTRLRSDAQYLEVVAVVVEEEAEEEEVVLVEEEGWSSENKRGEGEERKIKIRGVLILPDHLVYFKMAISLLVADK